MRFAFTDDQKMLRDTVRDVLARECSPDVVRKTWENSTGQAASVWSTLAETGVIGMAISERAGGMGMNELDLVLPLEEAGYAALPGPFSRRPRLAFRSCRRSVLTSRFSSGFREQRSATRSSPSRSTGSRLFHTRRWQTCCFFSMARASMPFRATRLR